MENLEPTTETGQQLHFLLTSWKSTSPEIALNHLNRIFFMFASKISNEEAFISALYGQKVIKKQPCVFMGKFSSKVFAVQHAIDMCLNRKGSMKKLIVALEWSENDKTLAEIFHWVEQQSEMKDSSENCPATANDSEMLEAVSAVIKMEATQELENVPQDLTIPAELDGSLDQAPAEGPQEIPKDDQVPASEAPPKWHLCRFQSCQLEFRSIGERKTHYNNCHKGACLACGRTDARKMFSKRYLNNCCNSPSFVGPKKFPCLGHCRKIFRKLSGRRNHMRDVMQDCHKCCLKFQKRDKHSC